MSSLLVISNLFGLISAFQFLSIIFDVFRRQKLADGGHLKDYYGRTAWSKETDDEYKEWCKENNIKYITLEEEMKHKKK